MVFACTSIFFIGFPTIADFTFASPVLSFLLFKNSIGNTQVSYLKVQEFSSFKEQPSDQQLSLMSQG